MIGCYYRVVSQNKYYEQGLVQMSPIVFQLALTKRIELKPILMDQELHDKFGVQISVHGHWNYVTPIEGPYQKLRYISFAGSYVYLRDVNEDDADDLVVLWDDKDGTDCMPVHKLQQIFYIVFREKLQFKN